VGLSAITLPAEQPALATPRLVLRRFIDTDAPRVQLLAGDDAVAEPTLHIPHPYPDGVAEAWIAGQLQEWAESRRAVWAITRQDDGLLLGTIDLFFRLTRRQAGTGYWVGREYWGQGIATEALCAVVAWGFDVLGLHRIEASHLTRNPSSGRVMEKAGMRFEGRMRESVLWRGRFEDMSHWAVLASDPRPAPPSATTPR
jgi:[ribosomal protein S5]-alanine N-acetyltransferase